jgi:hypothetical protein
VYNDGADIMQEKVVSSQGVSEIDDAHDYIDNQLDITELKHKDTIETGG